MLSILSPAKSLDFESPLATRKATDPRLLDHTEQLAEVMRQQSPADLRRLMDISEHLATLNAERFQAMAFPQPRRTSRPALLAFAGDVYQGMRATERFDERDFTEAQKTVRILSGLYGLLRPLDRIQPYRLEMGSPLRTPRGTSLYQWWGDTVTDLVLDDLAASPGDDVLVNLASEEYAKVIQTSRLPRVVSPRFEDADGQGRYRVVSFPAKRARGEMAAWLVENRVRRVSQLRHFDAAGYTFHAESSRPDVPVFRRSRTD